MSEFLVSNKLKLNDDKTHLMVMSTSQARLAREKKGDTSIVQIRTSIKNIEPSQSEKLLGCWLHEDMKWGEHIRDNRESLLRSLSNRVGTLKMVCRVAGFRSRTSTTLSNKLRPHAFLRKWNHRYMTSHLQ